MPIEPGVRIGAYTVQEFVGRGAMGMVYRAYHEGLARPAAVKVLQALAPDAEATGRFRREAQSIGQMRHPNVLQVFDFGEFEGTPYMVVEYVPGGALDDRLVSGRPYDQKAAIALLRGIGAALDYAHSLGVVHRDVKPANVLLGPGDTPILADFGLAKLLQSSSLKSMTGVTTGTPAYMAPEQAAGQQVGPAADRYALATVAYQLLTGGVPFQQQGVLELLYAHVHQEPPAASSRNPELPPAVDAVLARGLAKAPEARWGSCAELVDRLDAALSGVGAEATQPLQPAAVAAVPAAAVPVGTRSRGRRWPVLVAALALLLVAVILVGAAALRPRGAALSVRPGAVRPGEAVTLTADHLPAGQNGTVRFGSRQVEVGTFHADSSGHFQETVRVPGATPAGTYAVKVCWNAACPASANLTVG